MYLLVALLFVLGSCDTISPLYASDQLAGEAYGSYNQFQNVTDLISATTVATRIWQPFHKRASPTNYNECVLKGKCMLIALNDKSMTPSIYNTYTQPSDIGWQPHTGFIPQIDLANAFPGAGWNRQDFQQFAAEYPEPWIYPSFNAQYVVYANPVAHVVIVTSATSPRDPLVQPPAPTPNPPPLRALSDFIFLAYKAACNSDASCISKLEWVIRYSITNSLTNEVAETATGRDDNYPTWPGVSFQTDTEQGKSLVGCPNGWGVAFMLGQRADTTLGRKTIDRVAVMGNPFDGDETVNMNLAFHVTNWT
ncbi:hypothetical protein MMC10_010203 [Thelotrema lepadinum]|nr:hypothetical protein [Thelotrema lepadinum]